MSIIEKLGIDQLASKSTHKDGYTFFDYREVRDLEKQRDEMLEALIKLTFDPPLDSSAISDFTEKVIIKATGKTLKEIKDLL